MTTDALVKTGEAAEILGVSRQHVVNLCNRGDLPSIRLGTHRLVRRRDLEEIVGADALTPDQRRQLWLHLAVLTPLLTRPDEVMSTARDNIACWATMHRTDGMTQQYLREWERILDQGLETTARTLASTSPRACELRQNSPFAGVLSEEQRRAALASFRATHEEPPA
ncbi:helix-turn-helix domain-containing protein [Kytococcus sp. Marseille-QA3725]